MGDKDELSKLGQKIKKTLDFRTRIKEASVSAVKEVEESERQEQA